MSSKKKRYFETDESSSKKKKENVERSSEVAPTQTHNLSSLEPAGFFKSRKQYIPKGGQSLRNKDPYPGSAPVSKAKIKKYSRGPSGDSGGIKTRTHRSQLKTDEKKYKDASVQAARSELLLTEQAGYLEADEGEETTDYTQHDLVSCVDLASAHKYFELKLDKFGPYKMNYTRNGRYLCLAGKKGHVAAVDWQTKKLMCEINVMETCQDVKWLHMETMFAVAQKRWTYIYDNQGLELHCLKGMDEVLKLEFLPYHFLLASGNTKGYLQWLDVSVGKKVAGMLTGQSRLDVMCQNPANAILHTGHSSGTVSLWSPNVKEPLVKVLCHRSSVRSIAITKDGNYMATSGVDRSLKIWDIRAIKPVHQYKIKAGAGSMSFSQKGVLALAMGNVVEVYKDPCRQLQEKAYLTHRANASLDGIQFCPYEDVLGVGHSQGFTSLLVPGSGEPNFDALEANPYQTKKQRQQAEVKMLLEKINPELISLDTTDLGKLDRATLEETMEKKVKTMFLKPEKIDFEPAYKKKGRSKAGKVEQRKKGVQEEHQREQIRVFKRREQKQAQKKQEEEKAEAVMKPYDPLARFSKKA